MTATYFVISRSPVQVWSPAPFRFKHLQPHEHIAISSARGNPTGNWRLGVSFAVLRAGG